MLASEMLSLLSQHRTSSIALVMQALKAAEACQFDVNAFSVIARDTAIEAASLSDARYAAGTARPLEGLPIVVKDLIDTAGLETRYGSAAYLGHVPKTDADVVRILRDCGAIIIGKTTTHEFAWGVTTSSSFFGDTLNPRNRAHVPGGSSGGTAAAIAYGAVSAGVGTDTGGSVRIPAALCGVVGMKPTKGILPRTGIFPLAHTLDHPGLMGNCVDDVSLLAQPFGIACPRSKRSPHIAFIDAVPPVPVQDEIGQSFDRMKATLASHFRSVVVKADSLFEGVFSTFAGIVLTEGSIVHFSENDDEMFRGYTSETIERLELGKRVSIGEYAGWQHARRAFTRELARLMLNVDFLLLPTCPCVAPRIGESEIAIGQWQGTVREALMAYTAPFNVSGFPAISLPLTSESGALPSGVQIVGRPEEDGELLQFSQRVEAILAA
jgi:aspartyl-tRNA(Asn)/glutamyl-tRNA(Gln) amidotransferase subunit A